MNKLLSRTLVIDACVARACGNDASSHPTATNTRDFLNSVLSICHKVGMSTLIQEEWNKHQSSYALKWRSRMVGKKKLVVLPPAENQALREQIDQENVSDSAKAAMLKDCHMIEAALCSDMRIVSMDDTAKALYNEASIRIRELQQICWVNPLDNPLELKIWLEDGAPTENIKLGA